MSEDRSLVSLILKDLLRRTSRPAIFRVSPGIHHFLILVSFALILPCLLLADASKKGLILDDKVPLSSNVIENQSHWEGSTLLGDWGGIRPALEDRGITWETTHTTFYTGFLQGGRGDNDFEFSQRFDSLIAADTEKMGLWENGGFRFHLELIYGETDTLGSRRTGGLWPPYIGQALPLGAPDTLVASSIYYTHQFGEATSLIVGKINLVDLFAGDPFFGGWGRDRFSNTAMVIPPTGVTPPTMMGAILNHKVGGYTFTFQVFDPNDRTSEYWPPDLFEDGVNLSLGTSWTGNAFGRLSTLGLSGTYSTKEGVDLRDFLLPPGLVAGTREGSYAITLNGSHLFWESPDHPGRGLGFYFRTTVADGNPNPFESFFVGGLAAYGIVPRRSNDSMGLGYSRYNFSGDLAVAASPLVEIGSESAVEYYYNFEVAPWFHVTANVQWIRPALRNVSDSWMAGLRAAVEF